MAVTTSTGAPTTVKWDIIIGIAVIHLGALAAPWTFTWPAFWTFLWLQIATGLGVTLCYHRLLAHRSFQAPKAIEYLLTLVGCSALQGGPIKWVATHRVHHAFSDRPQDPHSPQRGFWWAHMLWLFPYDDTLDNPAMYPRFAPELARDPFHRWLDRWQWVPGVALALGLLAWGGWSMLIWGFFMRTAFVYHGTWLVNSAAHLWGYQTYRTNEGSRNNWWVALISYGEGWHNNHHAYLHSAAHGLRWWEVDVTYLAIRTLEWCGLADRVRLPQGNPARLSSPWASRGSSRLSVPVPEPIA